MKNISTYRTWLFAFLFAITMLMPQGVWAETYTSNSFTSNWSIIGQMDGICSYDANEVISYNGLNNSCIQSSDHIHLTKDGDNFVAQGHVIWNNNKHILHAILGFKQSIPMYTKQIVKLNYNLQLEGYQVHHACGLNYFNEDLTSAQTSNIVADTYWYINGTNLADYSYLVGYAFYTGTDNHNVTSDQKSVEMVFENQTGGDLEKTKYFVLNQSNSYNNNTEAGAWCKSTFKPASYEVTTSYYSIITFDANGGEGTMANQTIDNSGTLNANTFTRKLYVLAGWNTEPDGSGTAYAAGGTFTATAENKGPVTLYAQWIYEPMDGPKNGYYEIKSAGQLYSFATRVKAGDDTINVKLVADIVVNDGSFDADGNFTATGASTTSAPIGWIMTSSSSSFKGVFDGNHHTISGLYYNNSETYSVGFISRLGENGIVKNLGVVNSYFLGKLFVGGIVSYGMTALTKNEISNCYFSGTLKSYNSTSGSTIGGIIAGWGGSSDSHTIITNCYSEGSFSGTAKTTLRIGGIVGSVGIKSLTVANCYTTSDKLIGRYNPNYTTTCVACDSCVSATDFASGRIAYMLNGTVTDGTWTPGPADGTQTWYQKLGANGDTYPHFKQNSSNTVYQISDYNHGSTVSNTGSYEYKNSYPTTCHFAPFNANATNEAGGNHDKHLVGGVCSLCGYSIISAETGAFQIANATQLIDFSDYVSARKDNNFHMDCDAELTADIQFPDGVTLKPIGARQIGNNGSSQNYTGTFSGNGHTIRNLRMEALFINGTYHASMFDGLSGATVQNVNFEGMYGASPNAYGNFAFLTMSADYSTISNILVQGNAKVMDWNGTYAALADAATDCHIRNCGVVVDFSMSMTNNTPTSTSRYAAGLCKTATNTDFTNCYFDGKFTDVTWVQNSTNQGGTIYSSGTYMYPFCQTESGVTYTNCYAVESQNDKGFGYTSCPETVTVLPKSVFESGKVCYLLNGGKTNDGSACKTDGTQTWYQQIGTGTDPVLIKAADNTVYWGYSDCFATSIDAFSNTALTHTTEGHNFGGQLAQVDPTCTATGIGLHYVCSYCTGKHYSDNATHTTTESIIPALGHHNDSFGLCDRCWSELPTAETYTITESDGWGHARTLECAVDNGICYVRPFAAQTWATWFVPFDLSYDDQCRLGMTAGYVESIHNYDDDLDGQADRTVLNVMLLMGSNLKAGVPYLVKFDEAISGTIETSSHTLHTAADVQNVSAQTGTYIYNIVGNYSAVSAEAMNSGSRYSITDAGQMKVWGESALVPFRWSIVESEKNVTSGAPEMRIRVIGEENAETGLRSLYDTPLEYSAEGIFNLNGQAQKSIQKGINIQNGKRVMMK